jgi:hypothetical protein
VPCQANSRRRCVNVVMTIATSLCSALTASVRARPLPRVPVCIVYCVCVVYCVLCVVCCALCVVCTGNVLCVVCCVVCCVVLCVVCCVLCCVVL